MPGGDYNTDADLTLSPTPQSIPIHVPAIPYKYFIWVCYRPLALKGWVELVHLHWGVLIRRWWAQNGENSAGVWIAVFFI